MKFETYLKQCLQNKEFRKYWIEDGLPLLEDINYNKQKSNLEYSELFESKEEYDQKLLDLIKNKGIKSDNKGMTIEFYEKDNKCPVIDFLNSIENEKLKEKTVRIIYCLSELGGELNKTKNSAYVEDGIYELRTIQGTNIDRIFYFFVVGNKAILTNGYIKKSQKVDKEELKKAKKYREEYSKRK